MSHFPHPHYKIFLVIPSIIQFLLTSSAHPPFIPTSHLVTDSPLFTPPLLHSSPLFTPSLLHSPTPLHSPSPPFTHPSSLPLFTPPLLHSSPLFTPSLLHSPFPTPLHPLCPPLSSISHPSLLHSSAIHPPLFTPSSPLITPPLLHSSPIHPFTLLSTDLSPELIHTLSRMMHPDPSLRYVQYPYIQHAMQMKCRLCLRSSTIMLSMR